MTRLILLSVLAVFLSEARGGCICPSFSRLEVGNLTVSKGRLVDQVWEISQEGAKLSLAVEGNGDFSLSVDAFAAPDKEVELAKQSEARGGGNELDTKPSSKLLDAPTAILANVRGEKKRDGLTVSTLDFLVKPGDRAKKPYRLEVAWRFPRAGADGVGLKDKAFKDLYCVDKATAAALKKKADGYLMVGLRLNETSLDPFKLKIVRDELPVSLCANDINKVNANTFEVPNRRGLRDVSGLVSILFGAKI